MSTREGDVDTAAHRQRPRVVLVDTYVSDSFREFAAALRRRGVDVVYLRPAYAGTGRRAKRALDSLMGPAIDLPADGLEGSSPAAVRLRKEVLAPPTIDAHVAEPILSRLASTPEWQANPALRKSSSGVDLADIADKYAVGRIAIAAGVDVPHATTDLANQTWPVVAKGRLGAGGVTVRVVHDDDELAQAVAAIESEGGGGVFLERFYPGPTIGTCGVARDGEILVQAAYERTPSPANPLGPPVLVRLLDDDAALHASTTLIGALGYTGIFCLNFVRDSDGTPLVIDVNVRIFGSWHPIEQSGLPLMDAYLNLLGLGPPVSPAVSIDGVWHDVTRIGDPSASTVPSVWRDSARTSKLVWDARRSLGWGWMVSTQVRVVQRAVHDAVRVPRAR